MTHAETAFLIIFILILSICGIYIARKRKNTLPTQPGNLTPGARQAEEEVARLNEPRRARD